MKRKSSYAGNLLADIKKTFEQHKDNRFTAINLADLLGLSHKFISEIQEVLLTLIEDKEIIKDKGKYYLPMNNVRTENTKISPPNLMEGIFDATPLSRNYSYAFVRTSQGDFFVSSEDTLNAFHGDTVAIDPHFRKGKPDYCQIRRIVKRANPVLAGDLQTSGNKYYFICSNPKIHQWFEVIDIANASAGMKVMLQVTNWGNKGLSKQPSGKVIETLGLSGNPETELLAVIRQNGLPLEFPEHLITEIEALPEIIDTTELTKRKDFRNLTTFTIDPSSARDYDDAISIESTDNGWTLYVHIADVAHYIKPDSALFAECINRGNSYYFPRKVIPMLPEKLSNRICSLRQNEDKLTMTVVTKFDKQGIIKNQSLFESVITSNARLTYEEVDELFEGKQLDRDSAVIESLQSARQLSALLTEKRVKQGYLFFDLPETEYVYDEEGFVHQMNQSVETESHKLIENFMLVANQYVAEQLNSLSPVTMYRVHELPDMEKLERLSILLSAYGLSLNFRQDLNHSLQYLLMSFPDDTYHRVFDRLVLRSLKKAKYTVEHLPHFGLAINTYTHFTSPIRRLCDLVVHHLCKKYILHTSDYNFNRKQITHYAAVASEKEIIADEAEREIERVMNSIYMKKHVGEVFDGMITGMNSSSIFVQLNALPISGVIKISQLPKGKWIFNDTCMRYQNDRTNSYFQLMDTLSVQVMQVTDDVYLELVNESVTHKHHVSPLTPKVTFKKRKSTPQQKRTKQSGRKRNK